MCLLKNGLVAIVANRYHKEHTLQTVHGTLREVHPCHSTHIYPNLCCVHTTSKYVIMYMGKEHNGLCLWVYALLDIFVSPFHAHKPLNMQWELHISHPTDNFLMPYNHKLKLIVKTSSNQCVLVNSETPVANAIRIYKSLKVRETRNWAIYLSFSGVAKPGPIEAKGLAWCPGKFLASMH